MSDVEHGDGIRVEEVRDSSVVVTLSGEIDATLRQQLDEVVRALPVREVQITADLSGVTFMDSTGIGFLLGLRSVSSGRLRLAAPSRVVEQLLDVAAVAHLFDIVGRGRSDRG